jgi:hypothetical protein
VLSKEWRKGQEGEVEQVVEDEESKRKDICALFGGCHRCLFGWHHGAPMPYGTCCSAWQLLLGAMHMNLWVMDIKEIVFHRLISEYAG